MRVVADTNILIDYLLGVLPARAELARYAGVSVSHVTWMEVMAGARPGDDERRTRAFLRRFDVHPIDDAIAERAVQLRRTHRVRLPDAIIWATARELGQMLVTRNTKGFPANDAGVRFPYTI
jgi:predicted nucleic acid-binding protein